MTKSYNGTWMWMNRNRAEKLGMHHPQTAASFEELAQALHRQGRLQESEDLLERARAIRARHTEFEERYANAQAPLL